MTRLLALALAAAVLAGCRGGAHETMTPTTSAEPRTYSVPEQIHLVTLGDSLAWGAGDEQRLGISGRIEPELRSRGVAIAKIDNLGVNGAQTSDVIAKFRQPTVRQRIAEADAIVLSIGANDLFRTPGSREKVLHAPLAVAEKILGRIEEIVTELHRLNPRARILLLGGYNPVPDHPFSPLIAQYLALWDATLAQRFEHDPLVSIVPLDDIVTPPRLSRFDRFHPGGAAYALAAKRIAGMLVEGG